MDVGDIISDVNHYSKIAARRIFKECNIPFHRYAFYFSSSIWNVAYINFRYALCIPPNRVPFRLVYQFGDHYVKVYYRKLTSDVCDKNIAVLHADVALPIYWGYDRAGFYTNILDVMDFFVPERIEGFKQAVDREVYRLAKRIVNYCGDDIKRRLTLMDNFSDVCIRIFEISNLISRMLPIYGDVDMRESLSYRSLSKCAVDVNTYHRASSAIFIYNNPIGCRDICQLGELKYSYSRWFVNFLRSNFLLDVDKLCDIVSSLEQIYGKLKSVLRILYERRKSGLYRKYVSELYQLMSCLSFIGINPNCDGSFWSLFTDLRRVIWHGIMDYNEIKPFGSRFDIQRDGSTLVIVDERNGRSFTMQYYNDFCDFCFSGVDLFLDFLKDLDFSGALKNAG